MVIPPDFDTEGSCIDKFIFKQSTACKNSSKSQDIFVCNGDKLLCFFNCYIVPSYIPDWVNVEERDVESCYNYSASNGVLSWVETAGTPMEPNYHCIIFWEHPELSSLWAGYLAEFDWFEKEHNNIDPEAWLKELLWCLGFDGLNEFNWYLIAHHFSPGDVL